MSLIGPISEADFLKDGNKQSGLRLLFGNRIRIFYTHSIRLLLFYGGGGGLSMTAEIIVMNKLD